ncbi:MAG: polysaccharide pyruvyl transferase family protein [Kiritimatiellae bacterium]|nr:polysaccharide pyruvyl transferase family protein [Kiritimatiellia bacterium]
MLKSATLLGSSSGRNAGDAALIAGIMDSVDTACGAPLTYEIPTIRPAYIRDHYHNNTRAVSMMPWSLSVKMLGVPTLRSILRTDVTLIFDAILFDRALFNPLFNFMSTLYLLLPIARKRGKRLGCYDVGTGPVNTAPGRKILRELAEMMDFITVRDQASYDILRDIGVKNPRILVAADAALNVRPAPEARAVEILQGLGLDPAEEILGININAYLDTWAGPGVEPMGKEKFLSVYAAALNRVAKEIDAPMLFVCTQHLDVSITRELMDRVTARKKVLFTNVEHDHYEVKAVLGRLALLFGMRLHCMILASGGLTPIVGLAYQPKIDHYYESLGLSEWSLSFKDFSEDALVRHIRAGWEKRHELREHLGRRIPIQQRKADRAAELIAAIHRGEDIDAAFRRVAAGSST